MDPRPGGYRPRPAEDAPRRGGYPERGPAREPRTGDYPGPDDGYQRPSGEYHQRRDYQSGCQDYPPRRPEGPGRPSRDSQRRKGKLTGWTAGFAVVALVAVAGAHSLGLPPFAGKNASQQNAVAVPGATSASGQPGAGQVPAASGSAAPASAPPAGLGSGWKQTFNATFTGSTLDSSVWDTCYPWESQQGCANFGNSDEEFQWYQPSQDSVANGTLNLTAQAATTEGTTSGGSPEQYPYRSGLVTTHPGYSYQYGYLQVVAKVPTASGLWTALWLAASNEQWPPEIDILEHWDNQPKYFQYYHPSNAPREDSYITRSSLGSGYHTYGLDWTASKVAWYIDGRQVFETGRNVPQQPMYFLANVAVDAHVSSLPASTSQLSIKSVTVWQQGG